MGITISFGLQKGGVGKTTTSSITAWLLSQEYKVLAIDFDSQGNMTQLLTQQNIYDFTKRTVLEAIKEKDARPYIHQVSENLHILPAEDFLATLPNVLIAMYGNKAERLYALKNLLEPIKGDYDFIILDLPPNLGDQTLSGLVASDYAIVVLQSEPFAYDAMDRYLETVAEARNTLNPDLQFGGIVTAIMDGRTAIDNAILNRVRREYEEAVFDTVIRRKSRVKEFSVVGIQDKTKVDLEALQPYQDFVKELLERVKEG